MRGRRSIDEIIYAAICDGYRRFPMQHITVGKFAGVSKNTAHKAWFKGWPEHGMKPVRDVIDEDHAIERGLRQAEEERLVAGAILEAARQEAQEIRGRADEAAEAKAVRVEEMAKARLAKAEDDHRIRLEDLARRSRLDGLQQREGEASISRGVRSLVGQGLVMVGRLGPAMAQLSDKLIAWSTAKNTLNQDLLLSRSIVRMIRELTWAAHASVELERLRVGDPTQIVELRGEPASVEEVTSNVERANELLALLKRTPRVAGADTSVGTDAKVLPFAPKADAS